MEYYSQRQSYSKFEGVSSRLNIMLNIMRDLNDTRCSIRRIPLQVVCKRSERQANVRLENILYFRPNKTKYGDDT